MMKDPPARLALDSSPNRGEPEEGDRDDGAFVPALDLERHAPRALLLGLLLAGLLHATAIAYGKLMPPEPKPKLFPIVVKPIEVELTSAVTAAQPPAVVPQEIDETTIEVPAPAPAMRARPPVRAPAANRTPAPSPSPTPPPIASPPPIPAPTPEPLATFLAPPPPPRPRGPDRSAPARLGGNVTWKCPWPNDADPEMRHVAVRAQAEVRPDGTASTITILNDPGYGFGREARMCALRHTYIPAKDHSGEPTLGTTLPFTVFFDRY